MPSLARTNAPRRRGQVGELAETLERIARLGDGYDLAIAPADDGWLAADRFIHGGSEFDRIIERLCIDASDHKAKRAVGSRFVLLYLRFVWPVVAAFALERRVPDVTASNLLVRLDEAGWPVAFAMAEPRYAAVATDPAAADPSFVARDEAELLSWLHERAIDQNAAPLIDVIRTQLLTSGTALWGNVAAAFVHPLLWHVQHVAPEASKVVRDAEALLRRRDALRLDEQVRLLRVVQDDEEWIVHARRTCCLRWCLPGETRCADCPLMREPQAGEFLREQLIEAIARGEALRKELRLREPIQGAPTTRA